MPRKGKAQPSKKTPQRGKPAPIDPAKRFEGEFHTSLWNLMDVHSQSLVSDNIAASAGNTKKWSANTVRTHWNNRNWKSPAHIINALPGSFTAQLYPHVGRIADYLSHKNDPAAKEALAFIRYRYLKESFDLGLYRPYAESHRFSTLLNWAYFPDDKRFERDKFEPICFILAFNNDYQIYRHLCVLVDRLLTNPIHLTYLSDILPKLSVLMTLFGDYHLSVETCRSAASLLAHAPVSYERAAVHRYELQCIEADAESHIPVPRGFEPAEKLRHFVVLMRGLAENPGRQSEIGIEEIDHLLRMGYCAYFRALLRISLHLRIAGMPYRFPLQLGQFLEDFKDRASKYKDKLARARKDDANVSYRHLHTGEHYSGLEFDTLARAFAFIGTEMAIAKAKSKHRGRATHLSESGSEGKAAERLQCLKLAKVQIDHLMHAAAECLAEARRLFDIGDHDDQKALVDVIGDRSMVPPEVNCSILSSYRHLNTSAMLEIQRATFVDLGDDSDAKARLTEHIERAEAHQKSFEAIVGIQHLRHARILNERVGTLITLGKYGKHLDWMDLLSD